jgi:hypothetical protein
MTTRRFVARKALAIRRTPLTFVLRPAIAAAPIFDELLNEAVTSGPHKNKKHVKNRAGELNLPSITAFLEWLQASPLGVFIHKVHATRATSAWAFTTVEMVHVFAVAMVIGTIMIVDLRLLGLALTKRPFAELSRQVLPFTWAAFVVAVIAGLLLFTGQAADYFVNTAFWIKMSLIVLAGINMLVFEFITVRSVNEWNLDPTPPLQARLAGGISIACWVLVLVCGRLIGFTLPTE